MSNHTYAIEIAGPRPTASTRQQGGLARAASCARWTGSSASLERHLVDGAVAHFQVTMKVGFRLRTFEPSSAGR